VWWRLAKSSSEWNLAIPGGGSVGGASASPTRARARARRRRSAEDSRKIRTHAMPFDCISDEPSGRKEGRKLPVDAGDGFGRTRTGTATCLVMASYPSPWLHYTKCSGGLVRSVGQVGWGVFTSIYHIESLNICCIEH
jgi:hypothetical protein